MKDPPGGLHPLLTQDYALFTPPISAMFDQLRQWVDCRVTGAYLYGLSRTGKSKAVKEWFPAMLEDEYGDRIAVYRLIYRRQERATQMAFVTLLAEALKHQYGKARNAVTLESRIADFFVVQGLATRYHQVILLVDEAQYLSEREYHVLCNLQNRADDASVRLTIITVGTHQMAYQKQAFILGHNIHLSARFMARSARFRGISSQEQLRFVLDGYDSQSEWPAGTGQSYTKFFFPEAFKQGMRFSHYAPRIWEIYWDMAPPSIRNKLEVPMEYVVLPIEWICRTKSSREPDFRPNIDMLRTAVRNTDYFAMMRTIATSRGIPD